MALEARIVADQNERRETAGSALSPGDIVTCGDGIPGIVAGNQEIASGEQFTALVGQVAEVASASGTTFAAAAVVGWNNTTKLAVTGGTGDFNIGHAVIAKTSGQTVVRVAFYGPTSQPRA